jgi:hypothetical protein
MGPRCCLSLRGTRPVRRRRAAGRSGTGPGASSSVNRRSAWRNRRRRRQSTQTVPARRARSPTKERCATTWHAPTRRFPIAHSSASRRAEGVRGSPAAGSITVTPPQGPVMLPEPCQTIAQARRALCQARGRGMPGNAAHAIRDTHGPRVAYRLDAASRYSASSSALAALSTRPVPSQRLAHQMVPSAGHMAVFCHAAPAAGLCGTGRGTSPMR